MSVEEAPKQPGISPVKETAALARTMVRAALKGSLGTLLQPSGHPYASLLLTATEPDGSPVLLISKLALHTKNLAVDARASLLIDATGTDADPMAGSRITLIGEARPTTSATARRRYLARHPVSAGYADFPDFAFYKFDIASAHYIGGFGRIVDIPRADLLIDISGAEALVEAEPGIVEHMNDEPGAVWMQRVVNTYPATVWLNPVPEKQWGYSQSTKVMKQLVNDRMYPLTLDGLDDAMRELSRKQG